MTTGQICIRGVDTAAVDESVCIAARRMHDRKVGCLVVVDKSEKPIGIVTDRDLAVRVLAEARDPHLTAVGDVMSEHVCAVPMDLSVERALEIMRSGPYRRLPVVNPAGKLIGLLSIDDILNDLADEFRSVGMVIARESPPSLATT